MNPALDVAFFFNPMTDHLDIMPVEMITAYVPFATYLHLEEAARVAAIRDDEAATNLLLSMDNDTEYLTLNLPEGCGFDLLSVEPPSLR